MNNRPGWQTSEFWLAVFANAAAVGSAAAGIVPGPYGLAAAAATNIAYMAARTVVKARQKDGGKAKSQTSR